MWYGEFAGFALIGETKEFEQKVGHLQLYWAGGALIGAIAAALLTRRRRGGRMLFVAAGLLLVSVALSLVGWEARDAAIHPNTAPELRTFGPPSGAQLVHQKLGGGVSSRTWQSHRPLADVCREMKREFESWASNVRETSDEYEPCSFSGDRGAFYASVDVGDATRLQRLVGEPILDPDRGAVGIRLIVLAS
jgi:hypothetical protein